MAGLFDRAGDEQSLDVLSQTKDGQKRRKDKLVIELLENRQEKTIQGILRVSEYEAETASDGQSLRSLIRNRCQDESVQTQSEQK